ncbi:MAG: hypothetical protein KatS3mg102_0663 [Planctomycetota bacterium]|nr:MAG: hypothetical protein KatS3mg102_0663 [Planctomycetota bacterium]
MTNPASSAGDRFFEGLEEARRETARRERPELGRAASRLLSEVTQLLGSPIDRFDEVVAAVLEATLRLTGAERGFIMLFDDVPGALGEERNEGGPGAHGGGLRVVCERNLRREQLPEQARRVSRSIVEEVVRTERGIAIADLGDSDRFADAASVQELRLLSVMCVPLLVTVRAPGAGAPEQPAGTERRGEPLGAARRAIGVIYVDSRSVRTAFSEADLELFQALANVATGAIVHADTFRRATTDRLTGLLGRRRMQALLAEELRAARKSGRSLAVLLCDLDGLRALNAARGYAAGDRALVRFAELIRQRTRAHDAASRWGGEEFLVALPGTGEEGALEVARKVLLAAQGEGIKVSIGIAAWRPPDESLEQLLRRADQALSYAKQQGGGRARPWTEALAAVEPAGDKLAGVFAGEPATVYRNVLVLLESIPAIHQAGSVERVLERALECMIELARAERGLLYLRDEAGAPQLRVGRDRTGAAIEPERGADLAVVQAVLSSGEPAAAPAALCVPLRARGGVPLGAVWIEVPAEGGCPEGALAFLAEFAHQAAIAVEGARLLEENREKTRKIERLMRALEEERTRSQRALETTAQLVDQSSVLGEQRQRLEHRYRYDNIIGESPVMRRVFRMLDKVTDSTVPVYIHGESGTGKELVAKAIHFNGPRKHRPFIAENCGAVPETLLESELFGYVKGAFTGANADKKGLFELADGGTILLDEVGEMTPAMQTKLLRVLQEGEIRRVGGKETIRVDVRIISASNKDIRKLVEEGKFREDLFYRLNVVRIDLPPLRERREDIPLLVEHLLNEGAEPGAPRRTLTPDALEILCRHNWPGNVRELANVIERARILADGPVIGPDAILLDSEAEPAAAPASVQPAPARARAALPPPPPAAGPAPGTPLASVYFELNERQRRLIEYLQAYGSIRNRDYYEIMGVSKSTGWRDLKDLQERGIVQVKGRGKGSVYSLVPHFAGAAESSSARS